MLGLWPFSIISYLKKYCEIWNWSLKAVIFVSLFFFVQQNKQPFLCLVAWPVTLQTGLTIMSGVSIDRVWTIGVITLQNTSVTVSSKLLLL